MSTTEPKGCLELLSHLSLYAIAAVAVACTANSTDRDGEEDASELPSPDASQDSSEDETSTLPKEESPKNDKDDGTPDDDGTSNDEEPSPSQESPEDDDEEESDKDDDKDKDKDDDPDGPLPVPDSKAKLCEILDARPKAEVSGKEIVDWWEAFIDGYPGREINGSNNGSAAEYLRSQLEELGYETEILELKYNGRNVKVVQGLMSGTVAPKKYTVIGAHYDHVSATPTGAYDNASGVATVMSICTQLSKIKLQRSHACLFFDAEENGLWGSAAWVNNFVKKKSEDLQVVQMFGFDMAGLNWPGKAEWPLHGTVGLPKSHKTKLMEPHATTIETVLNQCVGDELNMKPEGLKVLRVYDKSSDEISFMRGGVPIIRFFGGRQASDYPYYHKRGDTKEGVYKVAGGRESFEMGIEMAVKSSYYTILAFDLFDPFAVTVLP